MKGISRIISHRHSRVGRINSSSRRFNHHTSTIFPYGPQYGSRQYMGRGYPRSSVGLGGFILAIIGVLAFMSGNIFLFIVIGLMFLFLWNGRKSNRPSTPTSINHPVPVNYRNTQSSQNEITIPKRTFKQRSDPKYCQACSTAILPNSPFCGQCGTMT